MALLFSTEHLALVLDASAFERQRWTVRIDDRGGIVDADLTGFDLLYNLLDEPCLFALGLWLGFDGFLGRWLFNRRLCWLVYRYSRKERTL
jgi:hypothetical protein